MFYKILLMMGLVLTFGCQEDQSVELALSENWSAYLGDDGTRQYSGLDQINRDNVGALQVAWRYVAGKADSLNRSQIQCNPLIIDGTLYGTSPRLACFAVDAATGAERWRFDPAEFNEALFGMGVNRGLTFWGDDQEQRIYYAVGRYLFALDASTGRPIASFGEGGKIDLRKPPLPDTLQGSKQQEWPYLVSTSPGVIFDGKLILGSRVSEDVGAAPGNVRAFNIHSGVLEWSFNTIPGPDEFGGNTWPAGSHGTIGGANSWAGLSIDRKRGWVFVPTGSAAYDFYGGDRHGDNLFANCVLALDARTGQRIWHYQTVHHDIWDRDLPAPPVLVEVEHEGEMVEAVAQTTKSGYLFLLDRQTGEPLFPVEERPFPPSDLKGELAAPTQPIPVQPPPFTRQSYTEADRYDLDSAGARKSREIFAASRKGGPFIPPSVEGTILFPGFDGGAEWGGAAFNPRAQILFVNASEMPWLLKMNPMNSLADRSPGEILYRTRCQSCHGAKMEGGGVFESPALNGLSARLDRAAIETIVSKGKGVMPAFNLLSEAEIAAVTDFILGQKEATDEIAFANDWPFPYRMDGYKRLYTDDGFPLVKPPWGTLNAIDLNAGTIKWQVPLGTYPELVERGISGTGSENYGGPVATAGGLLFIGATPDRQFRAFDQENGAILWQTTLPAAAYATPSVYAVNGKQFVVIACGGGKLGSKSGAEYLAFSLP